MAGILLRRPLDERRGPARHEAVRTIEHGQAGKSRVDQPQALDAPGQFVHTNVAGDAMVGRHEHGIASTFRCHFRLVAKGPDRIGCAERKHAVRIGDSHRRRIVLEVRVELVAAGADRNEAVAGVGRNQQRTAERLQQGRHAVGVLTGECRRGFRGHGPGLRGRRRCMLLRGKRIFIDGRHGKPAIEPIEYARSAEAIGFGDRSQGLAQAIAQGPVAGQAIGSDAVAGPGRRPVLQDRSQRAFDGLQTPCRQVLGKHREQFAQQLALFERAHHQRAIDALERNRPIGVGRPCGHGTIRHRVARVLQQCKKRGAAHRIDDEVNAPARFGIEDTVCLRGIEDPDLAGAHVHGCRSALEADRGGGHDRYVHTQAALPVVVEIGVRARLGIAVDTHQSRAPYRAIECSQQLADARQRIELRGRQHRSPGALVAGIAMRRDQGQAGVAGEPLRMRPPGRFGQRFDLLAQDRGIETYRQAQELGSQSQCCCSFRRKTPPRNSTGKSGALPDSNGCRNRHQPWIAAVQEKVRQKVSGAQAPTAPAKWNGIAVVKSPRLIMISWAISAAANVG